MVDSISIKFALANVLYVSAMAFLVFFQGLINAAEVIPPNWLIVTGGFLALSGGIASHFWEIRRNRVSDFWASLYLSGFVGILVGFASWHWLRTELGWWIALVMLSAFTKNIFLEFFEAIVGEKTQEVLKKKK